MTALYIKTSGEKTEIIPENGVLFSLKELQKLVGGNIEMLLTKDQRTMVVNEEGILKSLDKNSEASKLVNCGLIVGDVLVCDWSSIQ